MGRKFISEHLSFSCEHQLIHHHVKLERWMMNDEHETVRDIKKTFPMPGR